MSDKLKVLIVHNYYQIPGGEDTVVANEKKLLEDHNHEVILYTRNNEELKTMANSQKILLPFATIFNPRTYREIKKIIREKKIDIVHVHNTLNLISPSVYYAAFSCKIPVVQTIHNFRLLCPGATFYRDGHICEECIEHGLRCAAKYSCYRGSKLQTLMCVINTKIHRVLGTYNKLSYICLTEFNKQKLLQLKQIKSERVFVKPNYVEVSDNVISYDHRPNQFIYAGRLDELKGIKVLFYAWKQMGETAPHLIVCGTGPLASWCHNFLDDNPNLNIEMMGYVSNYKVKQLIANAKALILPTQWYEGFPMTLAEAFMLETPVIGSNIGNVGSIIENGVNGWKFQYDSPKDLVEKVRAVTNGMKEYSFDYTKNMNSGNYDLLMSIYDTVINQFNRRN